MARTQDRRIEEVTGEPGEWFVYLRPGWRLEEAHCFGEATKADIRRTMTRVLSCDCMDCRHGVGKEGLPPLPNATKSANRPQEPNDEGQAHRT